jgi:hypothetical protein
MKVDWPSTSVLTWQSAQPPQPTFPPARHQENTKQRQDHVQSYPAQAQQEGAHRRKCPSRSQGAEQRTVLSCSLPSGSTPGSSWARLRTAGALRQSKRGARYARALQRGTSRTTMQKNHSIRHTSPRITHPCRSYFLLLLKYPPASRAPRQHDTIGFQWQPTKEAVGLGTGGGHPPHSAAQCRSLR